MSDPLEELCRSIGGMIQPMQDIIEGDTPWEKIGDPDRIPVPALPWLGQFVGVRVTKMAVTDQQRFEIKNAAGRRRGTVPAMIAAIKETLTGTKHVKLYEQYTDPYHIRIETYTDETPDQTATIAAIMSQKPAGITMEYDAITGVNWDGLGSDDWDSHSSDDWDDMTGV